MKPHLVLSSIVLAATLQNLAFADLLVTYNTVSGGANADLLDPTVSSPLVTSATEMSLGAGAVLHNSSSSDTLFTPTSASTRLRYVGQDGTLQTHAAAVANDQYFDVSFLIGHSNVDMDQMTFQARVNKNATLTGGVYERYGAMTYQLQQSVNGSAFVDIGSEINWDVSPGDGDGILELGEHDTTIVPAKSFAVDLSSLNGLSTGDNVTLRLVFRNGDNAGVGTDGHGAVRFGNINIFGSAAAIPEPSTFALVSSSLFFLAVFHRRRRKLVPAFSRGN